MIAPETATVEFQSAKVHSYQFDLNKIPFESCFCIMQT